MEARATTDALAFAGLHMRTERGGGLEFMPRPYLREMLKDRRSQFVAVACAQSGKTVTVLGKLLHLMIYPPDGRARTAIYTFPTQSDVEDFSKARAKAMIESSPLLSRLIANLNAVGLKQFSNGSTIYFRGTWTERQAISIPADLLIHDELDRSRPDTLQLYSDRTRAALDPRLYLVSTPTVPKFGISAAWETSDQREWVWTCGVCDRDQIFAPMDRSVPWRDHLDLEAKTFRCCDCGAPVERAWILAGEWVPMAPENTGRAGYHITGIMPPESTAERLAASYAEAEFPELFVQGHIGLPEVSGDKSITEDMIAFGGWANILQHRGPLFAGLDQGRKLDFMAGDGQGHVLSVQRFDDWSQVASAMRSLHIAMIVCDLAPDTRPVQKLMQDFPGRVLMADYSLLRVQGQAWFEKRDGGRVAINRTLGLDATREPLVMGADGGDVFPDCEARLETEVRAQLAASVRTLQKNQHGQPVANWVETGPDHMRHAHLYYRVAAMQGGSVGHLVPIVKQRPDPNRMY